MIKACLYYEVVILVIVLCSNGNPVQPGECPFMILLFFENETLSDLSGGRFYRGGVLLDAQWVLSSSFRISHVEHYRFSALIARAGATHVDSPMRNVLQKNEQDRQVVELYEPRRHSPFTWWVSDISLMRLRSPFKLDQYVNKVEYSFNIPTNTICQIVMFERTSRENDRRHLKMDDVFVFDDTKCAEERGIFFVKETMACSYGYDSQKQTISRKGFCYGNAGGPLLCNSTLVGIQSSFPRNGKCLAPHSYHLIAKWDKFIKCSRGNHCESRSPECSGQCFKYKHSDNSNEEEQSKEEDMNLVELLVTGSDAESPATTTKPYYDTENESKKLATKKDSTKFYGNKGIEPYLRSGLIEASNHSGESTHQTIYSSATYSPNRTEDIVDLTTTSAEDIFNLIGLEKSKQKDYFLASTNFNQTEESFTSEKTNPKEDNVAEAQNIVKTVMSADNKVNINVPERVETQIIDMITKPSTTIKVFPLAVGEKTSFKNEIEEEGRINRDKDFVEIPEDHNKTTKRKRRKKIYYNKFIKHNGCLTQSQPLVLVYAFLQYYLVVKYF